MALSKRKFAHENTVQNLLGGETQQRTRSTISEEFVHHILESLTNNYQNPIEGLIRETISNAIDATRLLPEDEQRPVEVITPSTYNMQFTVIDYGVGMDVETLSENYVQYGRSTKLDDFSQTGSFGMGAKAPLAYTNEFKAVSIKDGMKTHYLVQRNADGIWGNVLKTEETDERNGTTVTVSLESQHDIDAFREVTQRYLNHAYDLPLIVDGKTTTFFDNFVEVGEILMDQESGTTGRVWMHRENFYKFVDHRNRADTTSLKVRYLVTGWDYPLFGMEYMDVDAFVELKPGLVTFNQSRDAIIDNVRSQRIQNLVQDYLFNDTDNVRELVKKAFNSISTREAHRVFEKLNARNPIRTPHAENHRRVNEQSTLAFVERSEWYGADRSPFCYEVSELQNTDGNAALELLKIREAGEQLRYPFTVCNNNSNEQRTFETFDGGFGKAWNDRHEPLQTDDDMRATPEDPLVLPRYSVFYPSGNSRSYRSTALKFYNSIAGTENTESDVTISYVDNQEDIPVLLAIVNAEPQKIKTLVRQRESIVDMLISDGVTALDGTTKVATQFPTGYSRKRLMIAYIDTADIAAVEAMEHTEVIITEHDDLRKDLRAYNRKIREAKKTTAEEQEAEILDRVFHARVRNTSFEHLTGAAHATVDAAATAAIVKSAAGSRQEIFSNEERAYYSDEVTLREVQNGEAIGILTGSRGEYYTSYTTVSTFGDEVVKYLVHHANRNLPVDNELKFYFFEERAFSAAEQKFIYENIPNMFVSQSWGYRAKISDTLREERTLKGEVLVSLMQDFSQHDLSAILSGELYYFAENEHLLNAMLEASTSSLVTAELKNAEATLDTLRNSPTVRSARAMNKLAREWGLGKISKHLSPAQHETLQPALQRLTRLVESMRYVSENLSSSQRDVSFGLYRESFYEAEVQEKIEQAMAYHVWEGLGRAGRLSEEIVAREEVFKSPMVKEAFGKHVSKPLEQRIVELMEEEQQAETEEVAV